MATMKRYNPDSVTVTLRSNRNPHDSVTRNIILRPDEPVTVGRSSRSAVKRLSPSTDNALFDCPVISRKHAQLELRVNKWNVEDKYQIYITDARSMHGTSVNGQKLQPTKPFQLRVNDVIRLGDSVNRGDSNYDGVMLSLDCISTAHQKEHAQEKGVQQPGIACPSDSESEFDQDDSDDEVEVLSSSVQVAPTQLPKPSTLGSSYSNVIMVDDEESNDSVSRPFLGFTNATTSNSIRVPDTYYDEEELYGLPVKTSNVERTPFGNKQTEDAIAPKGAAAPAESQRLTHEEIAQIQEDYDFERELSADEHSQHSDDGSISDAACSVHSFGSEDMSMSDFQEDDDDEIDQVDEVNLEVEVEQEAEVEHEAEVGQDDEDEGPEVMSSKRTPSLEIGTLGEEPRYSTFVAHVTTAVPARSHYDPVRGFQMAAPLADSIRTGRSYDLPMPSSSGVYTDAWNSNKWDVGPFDSSVHGVQQDDAPSFADHDSSSPAQMSFNPQQALGYSSPNTAATKPAEPIDWTSARAPWHFYEQPMVQTDEFFAPAHNASSSSPFGKKRKASEISTFEEPVFDAPPTFEMTAVPAQESQSELQQPEQTETSIISSEQPTAVPEPSPKKRRILQPQTHKSMLRAAAIEAGKYTAGAIIGGIGLVTILASPIGEALANC